MVEQAINLIPKKISLKYEKYKLKIKFVCITRFVYSSLAIVLKSVVSFVASECAITSAGVVIGKGATPLVSLEPSVVLERIPIPKVIVCLIGCGSGEATESISIFPPSLCSSFLYELDSNVELNSNVDPEWVCALLSSKNNITRCGITCW